MIFLYLVLARICHQRRDSLSICDLPGKDPLLELINRKCLYIDLFVLVRMRLGRDQILCHINIDLLIAKRHRRVHRDQIFDIF